MSSEPSLNPKIEDGRTLFDLIGGTEGCAALAQAFHSRVEQDNLLRSVFPKNLRTLDQRFALFLGERFGGPTEYRATRGKTSLVCRHAHVAIGTKEAERWLSLMSASLDELAVPEPAISRLRTYFADTAKTLTDPFYPYYKMPLDQLRGAIQENPSLATLEHYGKSLITDAAMHWDTPRVQTLLSLGARPDPRDPKEHGALYRAANANSDQPEEIGCAIIESLLIAGAEVNRTSGPGRCAPLHMAARRGHIQIARLLIQRGAAIDLPDAKGETPLRRAVNCGHVEFVREMVRLGADSSQPDKKGISPMRAARTEEMRSALQEKR